MNYNRLDEDLRLTTTPEQRLLVRACLIRFRARDPRFGPREFQHEMIRILGVEGFRTFNESMRRNVERVLRGRAQEALMRDDDDDHEEGDEMMTDE